MPIRPSETGRSGEAGYTLVELLVVLAIMGLAIAAVPTVINAAIPALQSRSAARALAADLRSARSQAVSRGTETRFVFTPSAQSYSMMQGPQRRLPYGVPFVFAAPRGASEIDFFADGSSSGGTIVVGVQGRRHRVVADWLTGQVSVDE